MASGDVLQMWTPLHHEPPATVFASIDSVNDTPVLDFDSAVSESTVFSGVMPSAVGIDVIIGFISTTATGGVRCDVSFDRINDGADVDTGSFAAVQSASQTILNTAGNLNEVTVALTTGQIDGIVKGDAFRMRITRDHDHADDDMSADMELVNVVMKQT